MSDREFERYLAILGGLLRLSANRREEIAAELRDHLEERLDELLAQGVTRDQAIITALEEFGDAAGLAGEFLHVFHRQKRRWVMRMTVCSVAVCVALGLSIMAIWPENRLTPPTALAVAQEAADPFGGAEPAANDENQAKGIAADQIPGGGDGQPPTAQAAPSPTKAETELTPEDNNQRTEFKLAKRMKVSYSQVRLHDALTDLAKVYEIDLFINQKHLQEADKNLEDMVELDFKNIRGDMLLDLLLRNADLNYTIQDGIVVVTTSDDLDSMMEVRVYNCRDLIAFMHERGAAGMMGGYGSVGLPGEGGMMSSAGAAGRGMAPGRRPTAGMGMGGMPGGMGMGMPGMSSMAGASGNQAGAMPGMPGGMEGSGGGAGTSHSIAMIPELDALTQVLTCTIMPDSWGEQGGPGTIEAYYGGLLIVNNNPQAHRKIEKLLKMMRDAAQKPPGSVVSEK